MQITNLEGKTIISRDIDKRITIGVIMLSKIRFLNICLCVSSLSACTTLYSPKSYTNYQYTTESTTQGYQDGYTMGGYYADSYQEKSVSVPESYHVGVNHSPTPHTDRDKEWVNSQNSQNYTIELADAEKPSEVANTLYKAPKSERRAEIKYQRDGKAYYKGVYGTYPSYEAAQEALKSLPEDVKQSAGVKTWGSVQSGVTE